MSEQVISFFSDPRFRTNPYPFYAQVRAEKPIYKTKLSNGVEVYLVTRYEDVQAGLKDARLVKNIQNARRRWNPLEKLGVNVLSNNSNMLRADPPEHTRLRALAHEAFTPKYVGQLRGHIQQIADELLGAVEARGKMDLIGDYAFPLPITVICEMLGVPNEDHLRFRQWSGKIISSGLLSSESPRPTPDLVQLYQYLNRLVDERRKSPMDDLISKLSHVEQAGDRLSEVELVSTTLLLLIAGHETTVNLIGNGMLALFQHPDQLEKLKREPELIKPAVEEIVRYVNPVQYVNRYAAEALEIGGVKISKGSHLLLMVSAANHDETYTSNPEQLDVSHSDTQHLAFGQGIHYCLGAPLARLEGEVAFATLLKRFPNIRMDCAPEALQWRGAFELRGLQSLPAAF